jgi:beta-fructofuranosidase/levanase
MFGKIFVCYLSFLATSTLCAAQSYKEQYRPQYHFSPEKNWVNDPNGMVYHKGIYHLYYQYNPSGSRWGNMSWGHASSKDLLHWTQHPIALEYRKDANGVAEELMFSGTVVADPDNTSRFGTKENPPLVAIYTSSYVQDFKLPSGQAVSNGQQSQSIAYSLDDGLTWTKYESHNPILLSPPAEFLSSDTKNNFRDPAVFWHAGKQHWVMVLSLPNAHHLLFYTSNDLKNWTHVSEFGPANAIAGQWECPGVFPLPVDGNTKNEKWVLQIGLNPGGPNIGSGTQYIVGSFDGITFTADADSVYENVGKPAGSVFIEDFEKNTWEEMGWTATGGFVGKGPVPEGDAGNHQLDTFFGGDTVTGTAASPAFVVTKPFINFRIGGGYHPYNPSTYGTAADTETSLNLKLNGKVVRSATGENAGTLAWQGWDVSGFLGQSAVIEIADFATGDWGHLILDDIVFSDSLAQARKANWVDLGPDYYAAATFNGLSQNQRIAVGWANNWAYGEDIPTAPWRSSMSVMREYSLETINSKVTLVQTPYSMAPLEKSPAVFSQSWATLPSSKLKLPVKGKSLDVTLTFQVAPQLPITSKASATSWTTKTSASTTLITVAPGYPCNRDNCLRAFIRDGRYPDNAFCKTFTTASVTTGFQSYATACGAAPTQTSRMSSACSCLYPASTSTSTKSAKPEPTVVTGDSQLQFLVRSSEDGSQGTVIGYDATARRVFVDRMNSGDISFNSLFPGIYYAPLRPDAQGKVTIRVLLDWSSVEVFGGQGESVITAQIFPSDANQAISLVSDVNAFKAVSVTVKNVASSWSS